MSTQNNEIKDGFSKAITLYTESINNAKLSEINNLFSNIVNNPEVDIKQWEIKDYDQFLKEIDPINKCQDDIENEEEDPIITKKYIPNLFISLISVLQEIQSNDIDNQIYNVVTRYLYNGTEGDVKNVVNFIIPCNQKDLLDEKTTVFVTILISSLKAILNDNDKDIKELLQNVLEHVNHIEIDEENKTNNKEYLNFMLSLFSELFGDLDLKKVIKLFWEVTDGNTEQIAEYISYLLYEHQANQKEDEGAESKHFGLATRIVIEEYIEPLHQKQRRQLRRNRNKANDNATPNTVQSEEEAANTDLNEIYTFIKQVLHQTCLDDDQNSYPKELALFFSSFKDFWEPDMILKFMVKEVNEKNIEDNYKEYYGPFLMDLADLMNWTNKQCETALLILTEGWKRKSRISIAKMMGLSLNDIKHLYNDCKDLTYKDADYLSDTEDNNSQTNNEGESKDFSKTKKPVVLSIRGSDFKRSFTKVLTDKDNSGNGNNNICRFYGTPRGCSAGKHCPFRHVQTNRSSYINRRLNHSMYSNSNSSYSNRYSNSNSRYHHGNSMGSTLKHRSSFQNVNNYRNNSSRNNPMMMPKNDMNKGRMGGRLSNMPSNELMKFNKKGDRDHHDKMDAPFNKKELGFNHKLRKQASFINPSSYRNQAPPEFKPIEAIDPALPQRNNNSICYYYNDPRGCSNGKNCKFLHINANNFNSDQRNFDNSRTNYNNSYDNGNNNVRKSYTSNFKSGQSNSYNSSSYNNNYNNSHGPDMSKGHSMGKKLSRHMLRSNDPKLKQEFSNYKKNTGDDNFMKSNNSPMMNKNINLNSNSVTPTSITIVNSSQNNDSSYASSTGTATTSTTAVAKEDINVPMNKTNTTTANNTNNINTTTNTTNNTISSNKTQCMFFAKDGKCKYGDNCKFLHSH